jgi:hypothetical protein
LVWTSNPSKRAARSVISGSALVTGLYFHDEVVTTIDASALTNKATHSTVNSRLLSFNADNDVPVCRRQQRCPWRHRQHDSLTASRST